MSSQIKFNNEELWDLSQPLTGSTSLRKGFHIHAVTVFHAMCTLLLGKPSTSPSRLQRRRALLDLFVSLSGHVLNGRSKNERNAERIKISFIDMATNLRKAGQKWSSYPMDQILVVVELIDFDKDLGISWNDFYNFYSMVFDCYCHDSSNIHLKEQLLQLYKELTITAFNATPSDKTYSKLVRLAHHARTNAVSPSPLLALVHAEGRFGKEFNQYHVECLLTTLGASITYDDDDDEPLYATSVGSGVYDQHDVTYSGRGESTADAHAVDGTGAQLEERFQYAEQAGRQLLGKPTKATPRQSPQTRTPTSALKESGSSGTLSGKKLSKHLQASLSDTVQLLRENSNQLAGQCAVQSSSIEDAHTLWRALRALETRLHSPEDCTAAALGRSAAGDVIVEALQSARKREMQRSMSADLSPVERLEDDSATPYTPSALLGFESGPSSLDRLAHTHWTPSDTSTSRPALYPRMGCSDYLSSPLPESRHSRKSAWTEPRVTFASDVVSPSHRSLDDTDAEAYFDVDTCADEQVRPAELLPMELFRKASSSFSLAIESDPHIFRSPHHRRAKQKKNVYDPRTYRWKAPEPKQSKLTRFDYSHVGDMEKINAVMYNNP